MIEEYDIKVRALSFTWDGSHTDATEIVHYLRGRVDLAEARTRFNTRTGATLHIEVRSTGASLRVELRPSQSATILLDAEKGTPLGMVGYAIPPEMVVLHESWPPPPQIDPAVHVLPVRSGL